MFEKIVLFIFSIVTILNGNNLIELHEKTLLVCFDGFGWDYLENNTLNNFQEYFIKNGVKANKGILSVFPTITSPNFWTIATGLYPENHGLVANQFYDDILDETYKAFENQDNETKWFGQNPNAIPIWILNELKDKSSRRSGIIGKYVGANVRIADETAFVTSDFDSEEQMNWFERVDKMIGWYLDDKTPINLGVLYFYEPDHTAHIFGPYSNEVVKMIHKCDRIIGYLIQRLKYFGLYEHINIIITSDHGFESVSKDKSMTLSDYVDISKFSAYGELTQFNIFPNNSE
jgi:predicted AlkP superfamily pyrophosphatase or phosphodiesterase